MDKDSGFTLAEVLVALMILSLASISLSQIVSTMLASWERTQLISNKAAKQTLLIEEIVRHEKQVRQDNWVLDGPSIETDDGLQLVLAIRKIDQSADCKYDLVGRRCR